MRRIRRVAAVLALLSPMIWMVAFDLGQRAGHLFTMHWTHSVGYWASIAGASLFWSLPIYVASQRRGWVRHVAAALFVVLYLFFVGVQRAFYSIYRIYVSLDSQFFSESPFQTITAALPLSWPRVIFHLGLTAAAAIAFVISARKVVRPRRLRRWLRPLLLAPVIATILSGRLIPVSYHTVQSTTPDFIYLHGVVGRLADQIHRLRTEEPLIVRVQRRTPLPVPRVSAAPSRPRNVLFVLQEAQRADVTCTSYVRECGEATKATNDLFPDRMPLLQMRSTASSTAVAISSLWSGLDPTESKERLHSAPLVWEYAHAAGYDTAYWTSQNLMFGNARLFVQDLPLSHFVSATNIEPQSDHLIGASDDLLSDVVIREIDELKEPFFAVVHYSNIHYPRRADPDHAPFKPADSKSYKAPLLRNHYKNVVYLSDLAVAKLLRHVRGTPAGARTIIFYTSDHGEALWEHNNENFHSATVYDEEIRVPAWIDAPKDTLSPEEKASVRRARTDWLWQIDVPPTILDLLGIWDAPEHAPLRARMIGHPITRPTRTTEPVPLTNTSWVWEYHLPNWGLQQGPLKLLAGPTDAEYHCFDLTHDPWEKNNLGESGVCASLARRAHAHYGMMPRDLHRLAAYPEWAKR